MNAQTETATNAAAAPAPAIYQRLNFLRFPDVDARLYQIAFLSTFLLVGLAFRGWAADGWHFAAIFSTAITVQLIGAALTNRDFTSLLSALITSLGLSLLLKTDSVTTCMIAAAAGIGSKFVFKYKGKHFFNPANFGIIAAIVLTKDAWVSPGQWGSDLTLMFLFGSFGMLVAGKVGRLDTTITFLLTFFSLQFLRTCLYLGWPVDHLFHQFANGTFWLFAFFMITDPRAIPNHRVARIIWTILIATTAFLMNNWLLPFKIPFLPPYVHTALIWSLFLWSPVTLLFDRFFTAERFVWRKSKPTKS